MTVSSQLVILAHIIAAVLPARGAREHIVMSNPSLVFGSRWHRFRLLLLALAIALGAAVLFILRPSVPEAASEPLSLILLGLGLAFTAQRLRMSYRAPMASEEDDKRQLVPRT